MEYYAGIDVSLKDSRVCVVDAKGKVVREFKVTSEPETVMRQIKREVDKEVKSVKISKDGITIKTK